MARWAVGDVQGCCEELEQLLTRTRFSSDRDRLWFVGDLVNRGPKSLEVLRLVHSLGDNAISVLGNHDLHLLAVFAGVRQQKAGDTLDPILNADDAGRWLADLSPVSGPLLGPFCLRSQALAAEQEWLVENLASLGEPEL